MYDIVMIGSSIFEFWQQPKWGKLNVANHAIRSTQSQDWLNKNLNQLPDAKAIFVYCGSNDLIYGNSPKQIVTNITSLLNKLIKHFPTAHIGYFSILKCPQKSAAKQLQIIDDINNQIQNNLELLTTDHLHYFDFNEYIANDSKWYVEDGLHLTTQAYQLLDEKLRPELNHWLNTLTNK